MARKTQNLEVGMRLQHARKLLKMTQKELAETTGFNPTNITSYELGKADVPVRLLSELYKLGVNSNWILTGTEHIFAYNDAGKLLQKDVYGVQIDEKFFSKDTEKLLLVSKLVQDIEAMTHQVHNIIQAA